MTETMVIEIPTYENALNVLSVTMDTNIWVTKILNSEKPIDFSLYRFVPVLLGCYFLWRNWKISNWFILHHRWLGNLGIFGWNLRVAYLNSYIWIFFSYNSNGKNPHRHRNIPILNASPNANWVVTRDSPNTDVVLTKFTSSSRGKLGGKTTSELSLSRNLVSQDHLGLYSLP